jgi:hypothetical protein
VNFRKAGDGSQNHVLDAGLCGCGDGNGIAVTTETGRDPKDVDFLDRGRTLRLTAIWKHVCRHVPSFLSTVLSVRAYLRAVNKPT